MSTRYMKKVYGAGDVSLEKECANTSDTEVPITGGVKPKQFNVFDLLKENPKDESEKDDCKDDESSAGIDISAEEARRKKKKKKKRKKADNEKARLSSRRSSEEDGGTDEIERSIREVNRILGEPRSGCSHESNENPLCLTQKSKEDILVVQHKHLNPYNELKRIFGTKTIQAEQSKRKNRGRTNNFKKTWLVTAQENWPPIGKSGLSMIPVETTADDVRYFMYEHDPSYRQIQMKFLQSVESMDPENIIAIINAHPYHVDALLQLSELCKLSEDLAMAAELIERALYCLECALHSSFNLTTAKCRLDYKKQQNRALFVTLFKHLTFVGGRACYRTSLEFCKLLLSFDPEGDPLAVILCLDFYALRAREYTWFVELCDLWESTRNLSQLPNMAYSLALANFHLGNDERAAELLQNALIMFPGVLLALLDKCSVQADSKVVGHDFFVSKAKATTPPALEKLETLYVMRSYHLWKEADVLPWLERQVHAVLDRVDSGDQYVKCCREKRTRRYQGKLPKNILRHIILADIKDVAINIQEVHNGGAILSHDPLPPTDSIDIYTTPRATERTNRNNSNLFSLFFSSLFNDIEQDAGAAAADGLNLFNDHRHNDGDG